MGAPTMAIPANNHLVDPANPPSYHYSPSHPYYFPQQHPHPSLSHPHPYYPPNQKPTIFRDYSPTPATFATFDHYPSQPFPHYPISSYPDTPNHPH